MVCAQCSNAMEPQERYCGKCGKEFSAEPVRPAEVRPRDWDTHVKVVAWIFIISALFMAIPGMALLMFPGMLMLGMAFPPGLFAGPFLLFIALVFISIPVAIGAVGIGLLNYRDWARTLTLIFSAFMLLGFPFGTAIGIYAFWVLLSDEGRNSYKARSALATA